jgi:hypothetical protein
MPVVRRIGGQAGRPPWSNVTSAGVFRVTRDGGRFDRHFHDCHEYWLISKGKAKVLSEDREYYVRSGDIVCTKAGDEHDVLEVYEDLEAFWFEDATPAGGRIGHLHKDPEKAKGHAVPALALPADFPQ